MLSAHHCDLTWHLRSQLCGQSPNLRAYCPGCSSASVTVPRLSKEYQHPPPCSCHSPRSRPDTCPVLAPAGPFDSQTKLRSPTQPLSELKVLSPCSSIQLRQRLHTHSGLKGALGGWGEEWVLVLGPSEFKHPNLNSHWQAFKTGTSTPGDTQPLPPLPMSEEG